MFGMPFFTVFRTFFRFCLFVLLLTQELMEKLKIPSDAQLMQIAIDDLNNSSLSLEDHHRALEELLILVEPIDNANGVCDSPILSYCTYTLQ